MKPSDVSVCLVTRGNVSLNPILQSLADFDDVRIWNNAECTDLSVYGRYEIIAEAAHDVILVQDDDCVLAPESFIQLLDAYEPGAVVCNMPERFRHDFYEDHALVGFGALFDRDLPGHAFYALHEGMRGHPDQSHWTMEGQRRFFRTCDVVFTALTPRILVDAPYTDLPWATGNDRMYRQETHVSERARMLDLVRRVRDGAAA